MKKSFEREKITVNEILEYNGPYWVDKSSKKSIITRLLIIYIDFYHEDEDYEKALVESVVDDFDITKEEMKGARNGWEPEWVKSE